jgi:ATP-dependent Clp protease ATP-binding subunit ClpC
VLEEGRLTDAFGRKVDFRNTIVVFTSNLGVREAENRSSLGFGESQEEQSASKTAVLEAVTSFFRPEFLNRVDEVVVFNEFSEEELVQILDLEVSKLEARIAGLDLKIHIEESAKMHLVREGSGPGTGARGLRRVLEDHLQDQIADLILDGKLNSGGLVKVTLNSDQQLSVDIEEKDKVN